MTDPERERIRAEAKADADFHNWKTGVDDHIKEMKAVKLWGIRGLIAFAGYLAMQLWTFISSGGVIK